MKTKAAVLYAPHTEYQVEEIELDPPKDGEVLVKFAASGMCHSDEHLVTGDMVLDAEITEMMGWQQFPIIAGHEGAGEVVEVGPGVTDLAVGDHVVTSFIPSCGRVPVVLHRPPEPLRPRAPRCCRAARPTAPSRHHTHDGARPRHHVLPRHLRRAQRDEPGLGHQDRARHPARQGRPWWPAASPPAGARPPTRPRSSPARPSSSSAPAASA